MVVTVVHLPNFPSTEARKKLSASQTASLFQTIASTLEIVVALPPHRLDTTSSRQYISTYASSAAFRALQNTIWKDQHMKLSPLEPQIQKLSLTLAEKLAGNLEIHVLLELAVAHGRTLPVRVQRIFTAVAQSNPSLPQVIATDLVPSFTLLVRQQTSTSQGLYAQRKIAESIYCFLRACKPTSTLVRSFGHDRDFILALANHYDVGMSAIATSYGGLPALAGGLSSQSEADDWVKIWVETKVALIDSFHFVLSRLLGDLASKNGSELAAEVERTFGLVFALLEAIPPSSSNSNTIPPTPFLNQSLLADYQHAYSLSKTLTSALEHAQEKDARLDLLDSNLRSLETPQDGSKNPGALKIILRSSGLHTQVSTHSKPLDYPPRDPPASSSNNTGPDPDLKASQVLDILPDTPLSYVRLLLACDCYNQEPEMVIEALLEGTAPSEEQLSKELQLAGHDSILPTIQSIKGKEREGMVSNSYDISQRRNVFDDETLDINQLRIGKKAVGSEILKDRSFMEEMKAEMLRRIEAMDEEEQEDDSSSPSAPGPSASGANQRPLALAVGDDDDDDIGAVRVPVAGDGEDVSDPEEGESEDTPTPETLVELAFLRDPKVFERDTATRRSKDRVQLKKETGWADEQIEGWKVMLERTPGLKERIALKHEFTGNRRGPVNHPPPVQEGGGRGGGRGRGRGQGRGRGRGGGGGPDSASERAWKDKNKASRGNHNRKRGHDKKMARAGAGPST